MIGHERHAQPLDPKLLLRMHPSRAWPRAVETDPIAGSYSLPVAYGRTGGATSHLTILREGFNIDGLYDEIIMRRT